MVEQTAHIRSVIGSSPIAAIGRKTPSQMGFLFIGRQLDLKGPVRRAYARKRGHGWPRQDRTPGWSGRTGCEATEAKSNCRYRQEDPIADGVFVYWAAIGPEGSGPPEKLLIKWFLIILFCGPPFYTSGFPAAPADSGAIGPARPWQYPGSVSEKVLLSRQ